MKTFTQILKQIGNALEFSNHVGSPTALHQLLAKQALQASNVEIGPSEAVTQFSHITEINNSTNAVEMSGLACVR